VSNTKQEIGLPKSYSNRTFVASFKTDPELWSRFKEGCAERGVSICHVLEALMEAWLEGQKATATVIKPVVINLTMQHVVQRPRRVQTRASDCAKPEFKRTVGVRMREAYVLSKAWEMGREFSYYDFLELKHDSFRKIVGSLRRRGRITANPIRTNPRFYKVQK